MSSSAPLVMKFGGTSFISPAMYSAVAGYVAERLAGTDRPQAVIVVSAMSGTTGRLREVLHAVSPEAPDDVVATMLTTGETVSTALMAAALSAAEVPAGVVSALRTGFRADGPADRAVLRDVDPGALRDAVQRFGVAIVPGGQAVDRAGDTVMLGRNSSDLSAVAAAAAVGADSCELFSDVPGVCSADPRLVPQARALSRLSYDTMRLMSVSGAKVLHASAVDWACRNRVELRCHSLLPEGTRHTVVDGTHTAVGAVVVADRSDVWTFTDPHRRDALVGPLADNGYQVLTVDLDGCHHLVTDVEGLRDEKVIERHGGVRQPDARLLTILHPDGRIEHHVLPWSAVTAAARQAHAQLYPDAEPAPAVAPKARSVHSGLLAGNAAAH
ncbi:MAG: hypothetical protein ACRDRR_21190 [Pseudonocardiaceae bacterium]